MTKQIRGVRKMWQLEGYDSSSDEYYKIEGQWPTEKAVRKAAAQKFVAIHSDNDPFVALKYGDILKEKLGAEVIIKHNMRHFSGPIDNEESCIELSEVVESLTMFSERL